MADTMNLSVGGGTGVLSSDPNSFMGSLRGKDPRRTSTVTCHVAQSLDSWDRTPGVKSYHFGPGQKVVGGELRWAYEERAAGKVKLQKSLDPAEILRQYKSVMAKQREESKRWGATGATGVVEAAVAPEAATAATSTQRRDGPNSKLNSTKLLYFDGRSHQLVHEAPGCGLRHGSEPDGWVPPHLAQADLAPGRLLGVRETPGSESTRLVASHHRRMAEDLPSGSVAAGAGTGPLAATGALNPLSTFKGTNAFASFGAEARGYARYGHGETADLHQLSLYAKQKLVGHREYEATARSLEGLGCWERTQVQLSSSVHVGHPSRLVMPGDTLQRMSLRTVRPGTT